MDRSESEGEDIVVATRAAIAASSPPGFPEGLLDPASPLLSPWSPGPCLAENKSLRNWGASNEGNLTAEAAAERDLRPSEAVSKASAAVSLAVSIQACDFCLNSINQNDILSDRTWQSKLLRTLVLVISIGQTPRSDGSTGNGNPERSRDESRNGRIRDCSCVDLAEDGLCRTETPRTSSAA